MCREQSDSAVNPRALDSTAVFCNSLRYDDRRTPDISGACGRSCRRHTEYYAPCNGLKFGLWERFAIITSLIIVLFLEYYDTFKILCHNKPSRAGWNCLSADHVGVWTNGDVHEACEPHRVERRAGPSFVASLEHSFPRAPYDHLDWILIAGERHYRGVGPSYFGSAR
jgi:hypothetical protein